MSGWGTGEWLSVFRRHGVSNVLGIDSDLDAGPGAVGERFDLFEAYRHTHGQPEHAAPPVWSEWGTRHDV